MAKRSRDWNEGLAKDLRSKKFAQAFLQSCLAEGISIQSALGKVVRAIGVKEFAKKSKIAGPNLLRTLDPRHNPTQETLNRLLKPLGLKLTVVPLAENERKKAA